MLRGLFARPQRRDPPGRADAERLKALARALLRLPDGSELTVSEIVCVDPACPGTETVLLVMAPGRRSRAVKVAKPAVEITEPELRSALVEAGLEVVG